MWRRPSDLSQFSGFVSARGLQFCFSLFENNLTLLLSTASFINPNLINVHPSSRKLSVVFSLLIGGVFRLEMRSQCKSWLLCCFRSAVQWRLPTFPLSPGGAPKSTIYQIKTHSEWLGFVGNSVVYPSPNKAFQNQNGLYGTSKIGPYSYASSPSYTKGQMLKPHPGTTIYCRTVWPSKRSNMPWNILHTFRLKSKFPVIHFGPLAQHDRTRQSGLQF